MKKLIAGALMAAMVLALSPSQATAGEGRGGVAGFLAGCCLGVRAGLDYNDGKTIHWRDWTPLIPYAGVVFSIWNGIDCAGGMTRADFVEQYGSTYY
ncbi:MAG: hypothetical protein JXR25_06075 [Pontiellaceae bacterium]|nr:hypothetical protein [Pontiellaceae bacterium]MBN2784375.1 hypothetical protein [Pontiellaceae bacterium]